jgi:hypothetical protein
LFGVVVAVLNAVISLGKLSLLCILIIPLLIAVYACFLCLVSKRVSTALLKTLHKATARFIDQGTPPEEVAKVILKVVTIENPDLRYLVGNDAVQMMEARKGKSDQEFRGSIHLIFPSPSQQ